MQKVTNKLRVLHYPQIPCTPFFVDVKNEEQALLIRETLANQHLFLFDNNFISDYSNIISVVMWDENSDGEGNPDWVDYYNEEEAMEFDEFVETYLSDDNVLADSAILDNEKECLEAVQRWQKYMRPLITIVSIKDGVLLRIRDVGRMLIACEKHFR